MEFYEVGEKRGLEMQAPESANKRSKEQHEYPLEHPPSQPPLQRERGPLAQAVVSGQRVSRIWNEAWKLWVSSQSGMVGRRATPPLDPGRWNHEQLRGFFDDIARCFLESGGQQGMYPYEGGNPGWVSTNYGSSRGGGGRPGGRRGPDPKLIEFVKVGQRTSLEFKEFWSMYCQEHGGSTFDPNKHATPFFVGCALCYGVKKLVEEEWAKPYLGAVGLAGQPMLARVIKRGQQNELKEGWTKFCEEKGEGKFDPELYDPQTLFEFMGSVGMQTYQVPDLLEKLAQVP